MYEKKVGSTRMMTFYITNVQDALIRAHKTLTHESGRKLIVRLIDEYLEDPFEGHHGEASSGHAIVRKSVELEIGVAERLREHAYKTGESSAALVRRLLDNYFAHHK